jgi:hypothetical protein
MAGTEDEWTELNKTQEGFLKFTQEGWQGLNSERISDPGIGPFDSTTIHEPLAPVLDEEPVGDVVNSPSHYQDVPEEYEHHRVMSAIDANYHFGNAMKYLWRAGKKRSTALSLEDKEIQDVRKAVRYLQMWLELQEESITKREMTK